MALCLSPSSALLISLPTCLSLPADFCLTSAFTSCCSCAPLGLLPRPGSPALPQPFGPSLLCPGRLGPGEASGPCSLSWTHRGPSEWAAVCPLLTSGAVCLLPAHDGLVRGGGHPTPHPASGAPTAGVALSLHCNPSLTATPSVGRQHPAPGCVEAGGVLAPAALCPFCSWLGCHFWKSLGPRGGAGRQAVSRASVPQTMFSERPQVGGHRSQRCQSEGLLGGTCWGFTQAPLGTSASLSC